MNPLTAWAIALWFAAGTLLLVCLAHKVREWDAQAEERRRQHDADAFRAQLAAMTDEETRRWQDWARENGYGPALLWGSTSETPICDATAAHIAKQAAGSIDDEWRRICEATGGAA